MLHASGIQICVTCLTQLKEPPFGRPDVQAAFIPSNRTGMQLAHNGWVVAPRARAYGTREEDTERERQRLRHARMSGGS